MVGIYKTIISLILWPIWFVFFIPSLFLLYILVFIIPPKYFYLIIRPICWIYCLLAGQLLLRENKPPPLQDQPYLYLFNHVSMFDQFMVGAFISHYLTAIGAAEIFKYSHLTCSCSCTFRCYYKGSTIFHSILNKL